MPPRGQPSPRPQHANQGGDVGAGTSDRIVGAITCAEAPHLAIVATREGVHRVRPDGEELRRAVRRAG